jgi:hypothetical protein
MNQKTENTGMTFKQRRIMYLKEKPEMRIKPFDELFEEYDFFVTGWCIHKKQILTHEVDIRG